MQQAKIAQAFLSSSHLSPVNFEVAAADVDIEVAVLVGVEEIEDISRSKGVNSVGAVLGFALEFSPHGVGLPGPGLAVGETCGHSTFEDAVNQRPS